MGIDEGFNLFPALEETEVDKAKWAAFLDEVKEKYKNDSNMTINDKGSIVFTVSEHPRLMKDGYRFRRFSSKITGRYANNVEVYLRGVTGIAKRHFGTRVHPWSELHDDVSEEICYNWNEVYDAAGRDV